MGMVPNFFRPDDAAFGSVRELWSFATAAYLDNPLPPLFKERLFVHLSRFCRARYCIVRHIGFLVGKGHVAGAADVPPQTVDEVISLLSYPGPADGSLADALSRAEALPGGRIPPPGSPGERDIFLLAGFLFLDPLRAEPARAALEVPLGAEGLELLIAFLAFVRTAHYWTLTHSSVQPEEDMLAFLHEHQALAEKVLQDQDLALLPVGQQLLEELEALRRERDEREAANRRQSMVINELNHRVKNMLAIVQSVVRQTLRHAEISSGVSDIVADRLHAIARAHDLLTKDEWTTVTLAQLVGEVTGSFGQMRSQISVQGPGVPLPAKTAVAVAMAIHELATNAIKYGALSTAAGRVAVEWSIADDSSADPRIHFFWREVGGPPVSPPSRAGFGMFLIQKNLEAELGGNVDLRFEREGLACVIDAPMPRTTQ